MPKAWAADSIGRMARCFQGACVLMAGAELDVFALLARRPMTSAQAAGRRGCRARSMAVLLDALAALGLLQKRGPLYAPAPGSGEILSEAAGGGALSSVRHLANCMRRWDQLAWVVKTGRPAKRRASILGKSGDRASFIGAMHEMNLAVADRLVKGLRLAPFIRLLDVGGGSGTWSFAFLRAHPKASAVIFDLPPVVEMARRRVAAEGLRGRVSFAAGDFLEDELPRGCDLAWLSAIAHQNSRRQNRQLFAKVFRALEPGGAVLVRDMVMEESRTAPVAGALFAVNMLVGTEGGGTFTFREFASDLRAAGFRRVRLLRRDPGMHSVVAADRP